MYAPPNSRILQLTGSASPYVQSPVMPTTEEITEAIEEQLKFQLGSLPGAEENWITAGMDSLEVIDVILKLETKFERDIPVGDFADEPTTESLVKFLAEHLGEESA